MTTAAPALPAAGPGGAACGARRACAARAPLHVLVATVVHHPDDARILHRQIRALLDAGHRVTYAAPFRARGSAPWPEVTGVDLPRAAGRDRLRALAAAREELAALAPGADLLLVHDPELLLALPRQRPPTVWDVHEDTAAALSLKPWLPPLLRPAVARGVRALERFGESRLHLTLAEEGYRGRFRLPHPVVPNSTVLPAEVAPPGRTRVVYLGSLTRARGAGELVELARLLRGEAQVELIGPADADARALVGGAHDEGLLVWHGFVPNDKALPMLSGALAGLSLLRDEPNYRHARPTKVLEYMAGGVPVVTTPNPSSRELVEAHGCGLVVPFADPAAAAAAVRRLRDEPGLAARSARRGREAAAAGYSWERDGRAFVARVEQWARAG